MNPQYPQQQQPPPYYPPQPPRKSSAGKIALFTIGGLALLCVVGTLGGKGASPPNTTSGATTANSQTPSAPSAPTGAAVAHAAPSAPTGAAVTRAAPSAPTGEAVTDAVPVGTTVSVAGLEATVLSARFTRRVSGSVFRHSAPEGSTLLVLSYRVRNTTQEPIHVTSFADEVILNGASYQPSIDCNMAVNNLGITDTLNPNLPRTFEACFEVPPNSQGFVVKFNRAFSDRFALTGI